MVCIGDDALVMMCWMHCALSSIFNTDLQHRHYVVRDGGHRGGFRRVQTAAAPVFDAAAVERLQQEIGGEDDALPTAFAVQRLDAAERQSLRTIGLAELDAPGKSHAIKWTS